MLAKLYEKDLRTVYGNNLRKIANICNEDTKDLSTATIKSKVKYRSLPVEEEWRIPILQEWRIPILQEMLFARENNVVVEGTLPLLQCSSTNSL